MDTKEQIRYQFYELVSQAWGSRLTKEEHKKVKELFLAHDKAESKIQISTNKVLGDTQVKIKNYLEKANKVTKTPRIEGNIEALTMCLKWLNGN